MCEEGACVPTKVRVRRGGCPGDGRRGSFVEGGDLLSGECGASPSLPRSTRTPRAHLRPAAISISLCACPPSPAPVFRCQQQRAGRRLSSLGAPELARASTVAVLLGWKGERGRQPSRKGRAALCGRLEQQPGRSIVTCSGPAPPHRPAPSRSLACSPAERQRRRDSGRRLRGRRERGRGECGAGLGDRGQRGCV